MVSIMNALLCASTSLNNEHFFNSKIVAVKYPFVC